MVAPRTDQTEGMRQQVLTELRKQLTPTKRRRYMSKLIDSATAEPNSNAGKLVAVMLGMGEDVTGKMDEVLEAAKQSDIDYQEYRVLKRAFTKQREFLTDTSRFQVWMAGRRFGKSEAAGLLFILKALTARANGFRQNYVYVHRSLTSGVMQMRVPLEKYCKILGIEHKYNGTEHVYSLAGSTLMIRGGNDTAAQEQFRGHSFDLVIIDEAAYIRNLRYLSGDSIMPTLADRKGSLILMCTPPNRPHTYFEETLNIPEWSKHYGTLFDNPTIADPESELDIICEARGITRDNSLIQREYLNKLVWDTDAMYVPKRTYYTQPPVTPLNFVIGLDYGSTAFTGIVGLAYNCNSENKADHRAFTFGERKFNHSGLEEIETNLRQVLNEAYAMCDINGIDHSSVVIVADTNEGIVTQELVNRGLPVENAYKYDKAAAMDILRDWFRSGRLQIQQGKPLDDELDQVLYKRDPQTDVILKELDDQSFHPDSLMALLYASRRMFWHIDYGYERPIETKYDPRADPNSPSYVPASIRSRFISDTNSDLRRV